MRRRRRAGQRRKSHLLQTGLILRTERHIDRSETQRVRTLAEETLYDIIPHLTCVSLDDVTGGGRGCEGDGGGGALYEGEGLV